jgi:hypothetical protein
MHILEEAITTLYRCSTNKIVDLGIQRKGSQHRETRRKRGARVRTAEYLDGQQQRHGSPRI